MTRNRQTSATTARWIHRVILGPLWRQMRQRSPAVARLLWEQRLVAEAVSQAAEPLPPPNEGDAQDARTLFWVFAAVAPAALLVPMLGIMSKGTEFDRLYALANPLLWPGLALSHVFDDAFAKSFGIGLQFFLGAGTVAVLGRLLGNKPRGLLVAGTFALWLWYHALFWYSVHAFFLVGLGSLASVLIAASAAEAHRAFRKRAGITLATPGILLGIVLVALLAYFAYQFFQEGEKLVAAMFVLVPVLAYALISSGVTRFFWMADDKNRYEDCASVIILSLIVDISTLGILLRRSANNEFRRV